MEFPLLGRSYVYHVVSPKWAGSKVPTVSLLVDPSTGAVEPNVNAVQRQEDEAYAAKYGKLDPSLYERMQHSFW